MSQRDARMPPALKKSMVAKLLDHFHLRMDDYAKLTDCQILELYFHKRDKDGAVETAAISSVEDSVAQDEKPPTLAHALLKLDLLAQTITLPPEKLAQLKEDMRAKYAAKEKQSRG